MQRSTMTTADQARAFYQQVREATARAILDHLIDHPDERFEGADLVKELGLDEHSDVARATYRMGLIAAELHLDRPWNEAQRGYLMSGKQAELLRQARAKVETSATTA